MANQLPYSMPELTMDDIQLFIQSLEITKVMWADVMQKFGG